MKKKIVNQNKNVKSMEKELKKNIVNIKKYINAMDFWNN